MRAILRFLGFVAVVGGFVALVIDMTFYLANDQWRLAPLSGVLDGVAPGASAQLVRLVGEWSSAWGGGAVASLVSRALAAPASAVGLGLGFLLMLLCRRRPADAI